MDKIENGCGVGVSLYLAGKIVNFNLALFQDIQFSTFRKRYALGVISEDGTLMKTGSMYSGGATGFGVSWNEIRPVAAMKESYWFITSDLDLIQEFIEQTNIEAEKEREDWLRVQKAKVNRINELPKETLVASLVHNEFLIKRSNAEFLSTRSSQISWYLTVVRRNKVTQVEEEIRLYNYFRKDGVMMKKQVGECRGLLLGKDAATSCVNVVDLMAQIKTAEKEVNKTIQEIARS